MKITIFSVLFFVANSALALTPDLSVYLRAGVVNNLKGGGQECINNKGAWANEFRLGNECNIYGEFGLGAYLLKSESGTGPMWRFFSNFAVAYDNRQDWEGITVTGQPAASDPRYVSGVNVSNGNNWVLREVYTEGGHFEGMPFNVWAGKRFYRWGDIHMNDLYPVDFSGPGAGITGYKTATGDWSLAVIQNSSSNEQESPSGTVTTEAGQAAKTTIHLRLDEAESSFGKIAVWLAGGVTPQTKNKNSTQEYKTGSGGFIAVKSNADVANGVGNELGVAYGSGVMSNFGSRGELVKDCETSTDLSCTIMQSNRLRAWDVVTVETTKWSTQAVLFYDEYNKGTSTDTFVRWTSLGVRPMYWFSDHFSLAFQAGLSNVIDESDGFGSRNLMRYTISPQMSLGKGFWSRPVIRAFYSRTEWNENNKISAANTSAANDTFQDSLGFQTEIWF